MCEKKVYKKGEKWTTIFSLSLSEVDTGVTCDGLVSYQVSCQWRGVGGGGVGKKQYS